MRVENERVGLCQWIYTLRMISVPRKNVVVLEPDWIQCRGEPGLNAMSVLRIPVIILP